MFILLRHRLRGCLDGRSVENLHQRKGVRLCSAHPSKWRSGTAQMGMLAPPTRRPTNCRSTQPPCTLEQLRAYPRPRPPTLDRPAMQPIGHSCARNASLSVSGRKRMLNRSQRGGRGQLLQTWADCSSVCRSDPYWRQLQECSRVCSAEGQHQVSDAVWGAVVLCAAPQSATACVG